MKKCIVTGGAGFIGSNLVHALVSKDVDVTVIDNLSTGNWRNLIDVENRIKFVNGDIRDFDLLSGVFEGCEVVFHQAALPSVPRSIENPAASNESNVTGTLNVLIAARETGVKRVVIAGSSSVYGNTQVLPKTEEMVPDPLSPYAVTKYVAELYSKVFARVYGLEAVVLRYFNVFGPCQNPESQYAAVIPKFITSMLRGENPTIYGDGEQSRDFTYVDNVIQANLLAATAKSIAGEVLNVGCEVRFTLNELVAELNTVMETNIPPKYKQPREGDVRHSLASIKKAAHLIGYKPRVSFQEGLRRTVEWFRTRQEPWKE